MTWRSAEKKDVAQESSQGQVRSYWDRMHVRDVCGCSGCSVAGIQVMVERAGLESPRAPVYAVQGGFMPEGRFQRPLGGWERSRQGNMDVGLTIQDHSHKSLQTPR